jgi:hypothetical protein
MSSVITRSQVRRQLAAMACDYLDIGILRPDGRMLLREAWTVRQIEQAIRPLRRENARGAHIFVRPHGAHALSLVDDLGSDGIAQMTDSGFQPALVLETSLGNFQVWVNHGRILSDHTVSTQVAKELARRFGGDPSSADWRHFGRLAGFTNQKPERRLQNGLPPFVQLHECEGRTYPAARKFLEDVTLLAQEELAKRRSGPRSRPFPIENSSNSLASFHADPRYGGDLHRADLAWALCAAARSLSKQQIREQILNGRNLSKKGSPSRQLDYAERTASKAVAALRSIAQ